MRRLAEVTGLVRWSTRRPARSARARRPAPPTSTRRSPTRRSGGARHHRGRGPDHRHPPPRRATWCAPTPSRSSGTATTPTSAAGCGPTASPASTAGRRRSSSGRAGASTTCHARVAACGAAHRRAPRGRRPGESEDVGIDWADPAPLTDFGEREPTEPWAWAGPARIGDRPHVGWVPRGPPVGARRGPVPLRAARARGGVLLLETSRTCIPASRSAGSCASSASGACSRPSTRSSSPGRGVELRAPPVRRGTRATRAAQRDAVVDMVPRYNPDAVVCVGRAVRPHPAAVDPSVRRPDHRRRRHPPGRRSRGYSWGQATETECVVCVGVPFGHTRPQDPVGSTADRLAVKKGSAGHEWMAARRAGPTRPPPSVPRA